MGYAVLHIEKGTKGKANGLGSHIDRTRHTPNADPEMSKFNLYLQIDPKIEHPLNQNSTNKHNPIPLQSRINARIKDGYKGTTAIRKDAVTHLNIVLTGSHEEMMRVDPLSWFLINLQFVCNRFGRENIVEFALHMDERTPHIHCVVVPLTPDGRLSAKEVMGNRVKMTDLQDKYGKAMDVFNLQRGIKGSKATHDSVKEYYGRINQRLEMNTEVYKVREIDVDVPKIETPPIFNREDWTKRQNEAIYANFSASLELYRRKQKRT